MKKYIPIFNPVICLIFFCLSVECYSQIIFEKGYFINNENDTIICLINNIDWKNNPADFEYNLPESSETKTAEIQSVKEFGIIGVSKYVRAIVQMDRSSEDLSKLSENKMPVFNQEILFLKVLVEGQASLYLYENHSLTRFFYQMNNNEPIPLVYKMYSYDKRHINYNYQFRQQLYSDLQCHDFTEKEFELLNYSENELVRLFVRYNECRNSPYIKYVKKQSKDLLNLNLRPGMNLSSFSMENSISDAEDADFGTKLCFRAAIELEYVLPFNKNKWAVIVEPTYQYYYADKELEDKSAEVNYQAVEFPIGMRYYFFLSENSKVFINASYVFDISINSEIKYDNGWSYEISPGGNFAFGLGYNFHNRYSLEFRYHTNQSLLRYAYWYSEYSTMSIIFGYSIF